MENPYLGLCSATYFVKIGSLVVEIKLNEVYNTDGITVRHGSHQGGSPQNGLGDEQTCGMTLASAYVLRRLSATWSQLQMKERESKWK